MPQVNVKEIVEKYGKIMHSTEYSKKYSVDSTQRITVRVGRNYKNVKHFSMIFDELFVEFEDSSMVKYNLEHPMVWVRIYEKVEPLGESLPFRKSKMLNCYDTVNKMIDHLNVLKDSKSQIKQQSGYCSKSIIKQLNIMIHDLKISINAMRKFEDAATIKRKHELWSNYVRIL